MPLVLYTHWLHAGKLTFIINPAACLSFEVFIIHASLWVYYIPGSMEGGMQSALAHLHTAIIALSCCWEKPTRKHEYKNGVFSTQLQPSLMHVAAHQQKNAHFTLSYRHTYPSLALYTPTCIGFSTILHHALKRIQKCKQTEPSAAHILYYWLVSSLHCGHSFFHTTAFVPFFDFDVQSPARQEAHTHCGWGTVDILWTLVFIRSSVNQQPF